MTKNRKVSLARGLGGLTAAVALLAGLSQANAQAPAPGSALSGAGSFPQSFIVPGTNTSLHVGGFLQMDAQYDMGAFGNSTSLGAFDNLAPESVGLSGNGFPASHPDHGVFRFNAQNSRFLVETRTPTSYGELKTFIELDFAGSASVNGVGGGAGATTVTSSTAGGSTQTNANQQSLVRMKQAYGTLGPWLFGQTNSNYADLASLPDTLDAFIESGIGIGAGTAKTPQIRFTYLLPAGMSLSASLEEFVTGAIFAPNPTGVGSFFLNNYNAPGYQPKYPSATAKWQIQQPWGHAAFQVAVAESRIRDLGTVGGGSAFTTTPAGFHIEKWGYQLAQSGHFNTFGKDKITWELAYGKGAGMYNWSFNQAGTQTNEDLVCSTTGGATVATGNNITCSQQRNMTANLGYSHWWTDEWRSGASIGYNQISRANAAATWLPTAIGNGLTALDRKAYSAVGNILWTPVAGVQFGLEYELYRRTVWSGAHGTSNRIHAQSLFAF
jgi:hypothetical protein